jgi:hypothetical protein
MANVIAMIGRIGEIKASFALEDCISLILNAEMLVGEIFSNAYFFAKIHMGGISLFVFDTLWK